MLTRLFQKKQGGDQTSEEYLEGTMPLLTSSWFGIAYPFSLVYAYYNIHILIAAFCWLKNVTHW